MKQISILFLISIFFFTKLFADEQSQFLKWKKEFKKFSFNRGISEITFDTSDE